MHMWVWFGYDLGEFLFSGLDIQSRGTFALTWIVLFFVALLFEASKVYLARVQRQAQKTLYPYRSDERRNLLCDREQGVEPTTSRNTSEGPVRRWAALKLKILINTHQTTVFLLHNVVGYLLMLAVMVYNMHLILAVVFGMMLGYFLFGTKMTRLQMQCFRRKRVIICTPECDDTAESFTAQQLEASGSSESDLFICRTRTCIQPSHYFPTNSAQDCANTCYYGAKQCPSKVARAKKLRSQMGTSQNEPGSSSANAPLNNSCCNKKQKVSSCCKSSAIVEVTAVVNENKNCCDSQADDSSDVISARENSPQITCCHNPKAQKTESQEQIM